MTEKQWKSRIVKACKAAGTYQKYFTTIIETLAAIMCRRDAVAEAFEEAGAEPLVEFTNKNGATNLIKNPMLTLINDLDRDALAYWRDLGLTPAGLKKINEHAVKNSKKNPLEEALASLG